MEFKVQGIDNTEQVIYSVGKNCQKKCLHGRESENDLPFRIARYWMQ